MNVNALLLSNEFTYYLICKGYSQDSLYGDEGEWTKDSRIEAIARYFWRLDRMYAPRNTEIRLRLIFVQHDNYLVDHKGVVGTIAKEHDRSWWKRIRQDMNERSL
jgi:hypothetical protein